MYLKCEQMRYVIVDEIENLGADVFGILEIHTRSAARKELYKYRRSGQAKDRDRPFGGLNMLLFGDWWQLSPVRATPLFANPFLQYSHQVQRMLAMFWSKDMDSVQEMIELTVNKRSGDDVWLSTVIDECREGQLCWENFDFLHGYPTNVPGSWNSAAQELACQDARCEELRAEI
jgi:hypothetical protein